MKIARFRTEESKEVKTGYVEKNRIINCEDENYKLGEVELLPPIKPNKLICVALNYLDHARETDSELPERPSFFFKPPSAIVGPNDPISRPEADRVDYEAEIAVVIGEKCKNISKEEADEKILGYTCLNDVSNRDAQSWEQNWVRAKGFDTSAPLGPWITPPEEMPEPIGVESRLNGEVKQSSDSSKLIFSVPELIEELTSFMTLKEGDVLATGTPAGVGPLSSGDEIEIKVDGVGSLKNSVC